MCWEHEDNRTRHSTSTLAKSEVTKDAPTAAPAKAPEGLSIEIPAPKSGRLKLTVSAV